MRLLRVCSATVAVIGTLVCPTVAWGDLAAPPLDPDQFSEPTHIRNTFFPLVPGTQYVYRGQADRDGTGFHPARVVFTVTDVTKVVNGVRSLVVWDRDFYDGELVENEIHFFAQEDDGDVWSLGEYPEEYEAGEFAGAPSTWLSGLDGAQAGIHIQGNPQVGTPPYVQGSAPAVDFFNAAEVFAMGRRTCVPFSCFDDVLIINEFSPDEPGGGGAHKYYAPGLGNVRVEPAGSPEMESLRLKRYRHLNWLARRRANHETLKLDRHAYETVPELYDQSEPAELDRGSR